MKHATVLFLSVTVSVCFIFNCSNRTDTNKRLSNISLYHHAKFLLGDSSSLHWLKENSQDLFHLANIPHHFTGESSIKWLEGNNPDLLHHASFMSAGEVSRNWLKKNNQGLYHVNNYFFYADESSLKWLKENNEGLYHYVMALSGDTHSFKWLREH